MKIRSLILSFSALLVSMGVSAQMADPVKWQSSVKNVGENIYEVSFTASVDSPWHIYDLGPYKDGPNPTVFTFEKNSSVELQGKVTPATKAKKVHDEMFGMEIGYYAGKVTFIQKVKVLTSKATTLKAMVEWQACDDQSCLPPTEHDFVVQLPAGTSAAVAAATDANSEETVTEEVVADEAVVEEAVAQEQQTLEPEVAAQGGAEESKSIWGLIIEAILWGFAALLTPCVFPMVPMTISFFMKGTDKAKGRMMAIFYGLSIIVLYTLPIAVIIGITYIFGGDSVTADIFNWLATHWLPNIIFFLVFMVFAASFFGAFEITMPSKLVNKSDEKADKGGFLGVFFLALTLVLVSFSCTGPIVGTVLIKATAGGIWEPIITMFAFSTAFALPFAIFAFSPSLLKDLPKSGGWLNSVKVVLGFVELALGLKFLSVADQTYHWGLLDREIYLALWIVIFTLMGLYLLGKLKFAHDSDLKHIGVPRLALAIITFTFVVYMIPGMWGAPLKGLSGYMPPMHSQDYVLGGDGGAVSSTGGTTSSTKKAAKYSDFLHLPHGLQGFFDFEEAKAYAAEVGKPLFVDFTGHGCVNCREMEARVWSDPRVLEILKNDYVIVALYADDKTELPESEWVTADNGKVLKGLGKINSYFAKVNFKVNAQPFYCVLNENDEYLTKPRGYDLNPDAFVKFLQDGIDNYKAGVTVPK